MLEKSVKAISILFALLWFIVIFTEYLNYNPSYGQAFEQFQYSGLLLFLITLGIGGSWGLKKLQTQKKQIRFVNGLSLFAFLVLIDIVTITLFYNKINAKLGAAGLFSHLTHFIRLAFCIYLIYLVCRICGKLITILFPPKVAENDLPLIEAAIGVMFITFLLFFIGVLGLLYWFVLIPIFLVILGVHWRMTLSTVKSNLIRPIKIPSKLNALGIFCFLFLFAIVTFDFTQIARPFPLGTDSINLYVNLSSLINDHHGLVQGNQPYNWSLFMSLGLLVFGRVDVVLGLSFLGSVLSLFALFQLSRKWLNVNFSALVLLLYFSVPMINFLSYMDMKIDMGLLFITLCVIIVFINWVVPKPDSSPKEQSSSKKKKGKKPSKSTIEITPPAYLLKLKKSFKNRLPSFIKDNHLIVLMGILAGFALGIKLTTLLTFFALMVGVWYVLGGVPAYFTAVFLTLGATFILNLDDQGLLRQFHGGVAILQWSLVLFGVVGIGYLFYKQKENTLKLFKISLLLSSFFLLPIFPWFGKNAIETKSFSIEALLNGKKASPPAIDFNNSATPQN